jgi:hypothetical protein
MCALPYMAVLCSSFISCFPDMLLRYFLNDQIVPVAHMFIGITSVFTCHIIIIIINEWTKWAWKSYGGTCDREISHQCVFHSVVCWSLTYHWMKYCLTVRQCPCPPLVDDTITASDADCRGLCKNWTRYSPIRKSVAGDEIGFDFAPAIHCAHIITYFTTLEQVIFLMVCLS